jgi:hypothetical protein
MEQICRFASSWLRVICVPAILICCVLPVFAQAAPEPADPAVVVPPAPASSLNAEKQQSCPVLSEGAFRTKSTIAAKITGVLDAGRLKAGKKLWVTSIYEMDYAGCHIPAGGAIYGRVAAASSSKDPSASELSLEFDAADCVGHDKQPMKLLVIAVSAPADDRFRGHDAAPTEVQGGARQITAAVVSTDGYDANLNGAEARTVSLGNVAGFNHMKLEPQGGPQCSARLTSTDRDIVLPPGTVLQLIVRTTE